MSEAAERGSAELVSHPDSKRSAFDLRGLDGPAAVTRAKVILKAMTLPKYLASIEARRFFQNRLSAGGLAYLERRLIDRDLE